MAGGGFERLRLYHYPATRSARVKWVLHEAVGDAFETIPLDLYAGAQYAPGYDAIDPNHNVPLLEIDFADGGSMRSLIGRNVTWARGYGMCQADVFKGYLARLSKRSAFRAAFADVGSFNPEPPQRPDGRSPFNG